jgi:hypothetical protein
MAYPLKIYPKNKGPGWLSKTLDSYIENPKSDPYKRADNEATLRYTGGDKKDVSAATYVGKKGK